MIEIVKKNKMWIIALLVAFFISLLFPYTGDDLAWKMQQLDSNTLHYLSSADTLNGRYLGNIFVIIMTKNFVLRGIFMAIVLTSIVFIISRETKIQPVFIWGIMLGMPIIMFQQSIVWTSGFTNYAISTLFLLIDMLIIKKAYFRDVKWYYQIFSFIFAFLSSLFIENVTIFILMAIIVINIIYIWKYKKFNYCLLFFLFGSLLGTITMFMQPSYYNVVNGTDTYRNYGRSISDMIWQLFDNLSDTIYKYLIFDNILIIILISLFMYMCYYSKLKHFSLKKRKFINCLFCYQLLFIFYVIFCHLNPTWMFLLNFTTIFNVLISLIYGLVIILLIWFIYSGKDRLRLIFLFVIIIGLVAPLCVVSPIGARNFFTIYILEIVIVCFLYKQISTNFCDVIYKISSAFLVIMVCYCVSVYGYVSYVNHQRINYILEQAESGNTNIKIPELPYGNYVYCGDFNDEYSSMMFKASYGIDMDVTFEFLPYTVWLEYIDNF